MKSLFIRSQNDKSFWLWNVTDTFVWTIHEARKGMWNVFFVVLFGYWLAGQANSDYVVIFKKSRFLLTTDVHRKSEFSFLSPLAEQHRWLPWILGIWRRLLGTLKIHPVLLIWFSNQDTIFILFLPAAASGKHTWWTPKILQKNTAVIRETKQTKQRTSADKRKLLCIFNYLCHSPNLLASESLFTRSTRRLYGASNVHSPVLIIWATRLVLV